MNSQRRHREISVSSGQHHASSHRGSQSSHRSSKGKAKLSRQDRFSSGYGTLSESFDSRESLKAGSPPPTYASQISGRFGSYDYAADNLYESIPEQNNEADTCIQTNEHVSAVRFTSRCRTFSAPDMLLDGLTMQVKEPFSAKINGCRIDYVAMAAVTQEDGKRLLIEHARRRFKLPTNVAKKSIIKNTEYEVVFRYRLLTQIEKRSMESQTKPYRGEKIRSSEPRSAWDYSIEQPRSFQEQESYFKVPGTEKLITCKSCDGNGKGRCTPCHGAGVKMCTRCHGFGREPMSNTECLQCGDGFETCHDCHGSGIGKCVECEGRGKVISYQRLKVNWFVEERVYVDEVEGVPRKQLLQAKGRLIHNEACDGLVKPLGEKDLFHTKIVRDSAKHIARYRDIRETVCKQKQTVRVVLAQRFDCQYKEKPFSFYVIGTDREIYAPHYPNRRLKFLDIFRSKRS